MFTCSCYEIGGGNSVMDKLSREEMIKLVYMSCEKFDTCDGCPFDYDNSICETTTLEDASHEQLETVLKDLGLPSRGEKEHDPVNHPSHYTHGSIECIDAMTSAFGKESVAQFCINNAFKYIFRHNCKNGLEDIQKAQWYLDKYIELKYGDGRDE